MLGKKANEIELKDYEIDPSTWVGKKCDGEIVVDIYNDRPNNKIAQFLPAGKGASAQAPF